MKSRETFFFFFLSKKMRETFFFRNKWRETWFAIQAISCQIKSNVKQFQSF